MTTLIGSLVSILTGGKKKKKDLYYPENVTQYGNLEEKREQMW